MKGLSSLGFLSSCSFAVGCCAGFSFLFIFFRGCLQRDLFTLLGFLVCRGCLVVCSIGVAGGALLIVFPELIIFMLEENIILLILSLHPQREAMSFAVGLTLGVTPCAHCALGVFIR